LIVAPFAKSKVGEESSSDPGKPQMTNHEDAITGNPDKESRAANRAVTE
jgi:hypothetical protein